MGVNRDFPIKPGEGPVCRTAAVFKPANLTSAVRL